MVTKAKKEKVSKAVAAPVHEMCGVAIKIESAKEKGAQSFSIACIMALGHKGDFHESHVWSHNGAFAHTIQWPAPQE